MAGFMAGFGSAFANSFNQDQAAKADHKEDLFKLRYSDYITRRDTAEKTDAENKKNMKLAASMVSMAGQPDDAKWAVYDMLSNGGDQGQIMKQLQTNTAVVTPNQPTTAPGEGATAADPRDNLTENAASSVHSQMAASGMQTPQSPEEPSLFGKVKNMLSGGSAQDRATRDTARADADIGAATGATPDQIQSTLAPRNIEPGDSVPGRPDVSIKWTPKQTDGVDLRAKVNNIGDAIAYDEWAKTHGTPAEQVEAKNLLDRYQHNQAQVANLTAQANGTGFTYARGFIKDQNGGFSGGVAIPTDDGKGGYIWKDAHGNEIDQSQVLPADKNMEADIKAISTDMAKPLDDYELAKNDYKALARTSAEISQLAKDHPEAMGKSGDLSQWTDSLKRAGINIAKLVNPGLDPNDPNATPDPGMLGELEKSEKAVNGMLKGAVDRNSQNALYATLMDIKATRLAYMWAKDAGQNGRGVSNADFNNFKEVAKGGGNPAALKQSSADFLSEKLKVLHDQEISLQKGGASGIYFEHKYPGVPNPFKLSSTIDDDLKADPELSKAIDTVNDNSGVDPSSQVNTEYPDVPDQVKQLKVIGSDGTPIDPATWVELSEKAKNYLKKKNGIQ